MTDPLPLRRPQPASAGRRPPFGGTAPHGGFAAVGAGGLGQRAP